MGGNFDLGHGDRSEGGKFGANLRPLRAGRQLGPPSLSGDGIGIVLDPAVCGAARGQDLGGERRRRERKPFQILGSCGEPRGNR
jgi:hypothetical protein